MQQDESLVIEDNVAESETEAERAERLEEEKAQAAAREQARHRAGQRLLDLISQSLKPIELKKHLKIAPAHVLNYQNDGQCGPIHACCWHNLPELGKVLIDAGCDVEARMNGRTPLMMAASVGSPELAEMILKAGAYVNAVCDDGTTALSEALSYPSIVRMLLEAGADRSIKVQGESIIERAKQPGHMMEKGRAVSLQMLREADQLDNLRKIAERRAADPASLRLGPLLWEACKAGQLDEVNKLIGQDADVTWSESDKGRCCLWIACRMGRASVAALLLQSDALVDQVDADGVTPLLAACQFGKLECAEACLALGARVDALTNRGFTPLISAIYNRHAHVANALIAKGANIQAKAGGKTALEWARTVVRAAPSEAARQLVATLEAMEGREANAQQELTTLMQRGMGMQAGVPDGGSFAKGVQDTLKDAVSVS